jgi:hypothetical protein
MRDDICNVSEIRKNNDFNAYLSSNPFNLALSELTDNERIQKLVVSGISPFLHGQTGVGKSARVKQEDSDVTTIYLCNQTIDSLNGKSVYVPPLTKKVSRLVYKTNSQGVKSQSYEYQNVTVRDGYMMDVKPAWLEKLEEKCANEPDKIHIVFFDEITNAPPAIQGFCFNIILDREVNGIWKLPENARIVAAGNDMKDSLAANQLAEPLFNRFAHVYIKTTTKSWLMWASEHNIHPAIYSYIAYRKGKVLRSKYDGKKPNADPRKWEMASNMLYATGNPEMLRALVGEDITKEFVNFCNQRVITLFDVINDNYTNEEVQELNTAERYATTMALSQVNEENLDKVRAFVKDLGAEFVAVFDALWTHGEESKLERIAEAKLAEEQEMSLKK